MYCHCVFFHLLLEAVHLLPEGKKHISYVFWLLGNNTTFFRIMFSHAVTTIGLLELPETVVQVVEGLLVDRR